MTDPHGPAASAGDADDAITQSRMDRLEAEQARVVGRIERDARAARGEASELEVIDTVLGAFERDVAAGGGVLAGAVAFRVFLFMIPYVFLLVVIFGLGASAASEDPGQPGPRRGDRRARGEGVRRHRRPVDRPADPLVLRRRRSRCSSPRARC